MRVYQRGPTSIPLRCGTATYGFNHVLQRWNDAYDSQIALTIARGEVTPDGSRYSLFTPKCKELFRVIVNQGPIGKAGFRPQGIITAYATDDLRTSAALTPSATDIDRCPLYQGINGHT